MQIILLVLFILPFFYKTFFWLYTIQLKDYRLDRFKEYILTPQWKGALFNFWFMIEFPILLFILLIYSKFNLVWVVFNMLFYLLILENIFVIWKIIRKRIILPVFTSRVTILFFLTLLLVSFLLFFTFYLKIFYFALLFILIFIYLFIWLTNIILLPLVNYKKNKLINKAIKISDKYSKPIKIWITWSVWKSSVKEYLASILNNQEKTLKTPDNINSELWVSDFIINNLNNNYKYFVAELWAYKIWEIELLWNIANHKYWFLTWIWNQHLWLFWNIENTIKAKSEIWKKVIINNWVLYVNFDNKYISQIKFPKELNYIKYWIDWRNLDAKSFIKKVKDWKTIFDFTYRWVTTEFETFLLWKHNIINLTWVISISIDLWVKTNELKKSISRIIPLRNTLKITKKEEVTIIDDTYNLSEDWLFAWIDVLSSFEWNKTLVLDDIIELWKDSKQIHYNIWVKIGKSWLVDNILYIWVNYEKNFVKWLLDSWFNQKNILKDLKNFNEWDIVLLEWKASKKYFNLKENV